MVKKDKKQKKVKKAISKKKALLIAVGVVMAPFLVFFGCVAFLMSFPGNAKKALAVADMFTPSGDNWHLVEEDVRPYTFLCFNDVPCGRVFRSWTSEKKDIDSNEALQKIISEIGYDFDVSGDCSSDSEEIFMCSADGEVGDYDVSVYKTKKNSISLVVKIRR